MNQPRQNQKHMKTKLLPSTGQERGIESCFSGFWMPVKSMQ